ncbi:transglutaminase domain-containing protein [Herbivorax sp. ANBcel31]|uniref:DUF4129 domain-containing transglutaminase family protein n=1 Tax=Herbivorax sp. ANBcel31 TaxID=3069754 RepID=UPI0027B3BAEB|nr:transglutaminase domain-containing protein [Herbivorax sp. ANBcel31]MDQ2085997.1 transglutaminase domain-containing protein [Herbivorax sp. ANBcel31]
MKGVKLTDYFAKLILSLLASFSLIFPLTTTLLVPYKHYEIAGMSLIVLLVLSIIFIHPKVLKFSMICIVSGIVATLLYLFKNDLLFYLYNPITWLVDYIRDIEPHNLSHSSFIAILFCIGISTLVFIFTFIKFNFLLIVLSGSILFSSQWILGFFMDKAYISFYTFCACILIYYFTHIYYKKSKQNTNNIVKLSNFIAFTTPICIIIILLINLIPVSSKPIQWDWMDNKVQNIYNDLTFRFGNDGKFDSTQNMGVFSLTSLGFGDSESLGGDVRLDNTKVLEVESEERIYLRGRSSNYYENNNWSLDYQSTNDDLLENKIRASSEANEIYNVNSMRHNDFYSQLILIEKAYPDSTTYSYDFYSDIFSVIDAKFTYHDIKTNSIFAPLNLNFFEFKNTNIEENLLTLNIDDILSYDKPFEKGHSYSFNSTFFDATNQISQKILRQSFNNFNSNHLRKIISKISDSILNNSYNRLTNFFEEPYIDLHSQSDSLADASTPPLMIEEAEAAHYNRLKSVKTSDDIIFKYIDIDDMTELELLITSFFLDDFSNVPHSTLKINSRIIRSLQDYFFLEFSDYEYHVDFFYDYAAQANTDLSSLFGEYNFYREVLYYVDFILDNYTYIPDTLPDRVHQLAHEITKDAENNFDKVKAIETYLSENYLYTLLPGDTPEGRDFVDYFLFDQKEGYCTYFATAMAILTRCIDIPSRYIEGYRLPLESTEENLYEVRNNHAHAWVEVYFEGFGWVTFEPTAGYNQTFYDATPAPSPSPVDYEQPASRLSNHELNSDNMSQSPLQNSQNDTPLNMHLILIALLVVVIITLIIIFNMLRRKIKLRKIYNLNARECIIKLFENYLKHLKLQKQSVIDGETPIEYANRIDSYGHFHPNTFSEITNLFVKARYSQLEITNQDKEFVYNFYKHISGITRKKLKLRYFFIAF